MTTMNTIYGAMWQLFCRNEGRAYAVRFMILMSSVRNHLYFTDQLRGFAGSLGPSQVTMSGPDLSLGAGKDDGLGVTAASFGSRGLSSPADSSSRRSSVDCAGEAIIVAVTEAARDGGDAEAMLKRCSLSYYICRAHDSYGRTSDARSVHTRSQRK